MLHFNFADFPVILLSSLFPYGDGQFQKFVFNFVILLKSRMLAKYTIYGIHTLCGCRGSQLEIFCTVSG